MASPGAGNAPCAGLDEPVRLRIGDAPYECALMVRASRLLPARGAHYKSAGQGVYHSIRRLGGSVTPIDLDRIDPKPERPKACAGSTSDPAQALEIDHEEPSRLDERVGSTLICLF
jgi:hypothetical protein